MKTLLRNCLGALILTASLSVQAQFDYVTNADGTSITITGYSSSGPAAVVIPSVINGLTVSAIGDNAFYDWGISSVSIPSSVITVGSNAFYNCTGLSSVTISNGLASIGDFAFEGCASLSEFTLPTTVTNLGIGAFSACPGLVEISVILQNLVYSSLNGVLFDKAGTTLIEYPGGLTGGYAIPIGVIAIGAYAFDWGGVTNVTIPDSVNTIGDNAFEWCDDLVEMTIPSSVTNIGGGVFANSGVENVTIPGSAGSIQGGTFYGTDLTRFAVPEGITNIEDGAFQSCSALTNVTIAGTVTNLGVSAFSGCDELTQVFFNGNAPAVDSSVFVNIGFNSEFGFEYNYYVSTAYYLPGTTGWSEFSSNAMIPAVLWNPSIQTGGPNFGVQGNQFGFDITGTTNIPIAVEASTNLVQSGWFPSQTLTLTNGLIHFSELLQTNATARFYRISAP